MKNTSEDGLYTMQCISYIICNHYIIIYIIYYTIKINERATMKKQKKH